LKGATVLAALVVVAGIVVAIYIGSDGANVRQDSQAQAQVQVAQHDARADIETARYDAEARIAAAQLDTQARMEESRQATQRTWLWTGVLPVEIGRAHV
jgi:hypothetical protein